MRRYLVQRVLAFLPILIGVSLLVFMAIRLIPGDVITATLGTEAGMLTDTQRESLRRYYGLDRPVTEQYVNWITRAVVGDLGISTRHGKPVTELIAERFPVTLQLALMAVTLGLLVGVPLGIIAAVRYNSILDLLVRLLALAGLVMPGFLVGTLIIFVLSTVFGILPNAGNFARFNENPGLNLQQMIFPAITLGFAFSASIMRMTRSSMLEVLGEDYVRTARSKGLRERQVVTRHALRNALIPVVTLVGVEMGYLLGGTFIIETLFSLPGLGRLLINAISQRDYALVQGATLFIAFTFVLINLVIDLLYAAVDPRISYERNRA
ncbi:MAG TPA: ABC transporter permease [Aggregatilineales bacterium]|nr:ABC transporter permease [Aggregatilineales bacterium]